MTSLGGVASLGGDSGVAAGRDGERGRLRQDTHTLHPEGSCVIGYFARDSNNSK